MSLPPPLSYAPPLGLYYKTVWDTKDVPSEQVVDGTVVFTPRFDSLVIYGRTVSSIYPEDEESYKRLAQLKRVMGEWFSEVCPEGELGSHALADLTPISEGEFAAAYDRGWR